MSDSAGSDESLFPIAVLIDELRHEDVQVNFFLLIKFKYFQLKNLVSTNDRERERDTCVSHYDPCH